MRNLPGVSPHCRRLVTWLSITAMSGVGRSCGVISDHKSLGSVSRNQRPTYIQLTVRNNSYILVWPCAKLCATHVAYAGESKKL